MAGLGRPTALTAAERALQDQTNILPRRQLIVVFAVLSITLLIAFIDQNGISVTLPTIASDLDAGATISWAGTSSLIANTVFQMLYGRLSDIFGRKNVLLSAVGMLALADLACGLSQNPAMFYVFRGVAGIGGGGIGSVTSIIVSDVVTLEQRGKWQGVIGSMVGLGNVIGPFLAAGFMQGLKGSASWRAFFWLLAPLGTVIGCLAWYFLPDSPPSGDLMENVRKIDYAGTLAMSIGVILLLIPISGGGAYYEWNSPMVISMLVIGSISFILFILVEWKFAKLPMMPLNIFRHKVVSTVLVQTFLLGGVYQSQIYFIPLYMQNARRFSVIKSAALYVPLFAMQAVSSTLSGQYIVRTQRYGEVIWFGFAAWTLGTGLTLTWTRTSSPGAIVAPLIVIGLGVGCIFQPTLVALQAHSPKPRRAIIIANRNFFRCAGGAVGLVISAAVLQAALRSRLPAGYQHLAESTYALPPDVTEMNDIEAADQIMDAYMQASRAVCLTQVPLIGTALLGCLFVKDKGLQASDERNKQEEEKRARDVEESAGCEAGGGEKPEVSVDRSGAERKGTVSET